MLFCTACFFQRVLITQMLVCTAPQIISVDDNTVAFAQWGLGSMARGEQEELPDTVVSKKSRHSTATLPASAGKTPGGLGAAWLATTRHVLCLTPKAPCGVSLSFDFELNS